MKFYNMFCGSILAFFLLNGCGGNSSESTISQSTSQSTKVGIVSDSQIIGLRYISTNKNKTQTKKGITNSKGEFEYFEDGTTDFFVGNIKIGSTIPNKFVAITTIVQTEKESENIARFLQTIDEDGNPNNGIQISASVDEHAKNVSLKFDDSFDTNFESVKTELFKGVANVPETVTVEQALNHANKSVRLSSLKEFDLYKAVANEKNYSSTYYNTDVLEKSQRKRVYLWIWEKLLSKEMAIEDELQFTKPEFDINNVEETRNQIKKYLDYADVVTGVASLGQGTYENITNAGTRSFSYEVTKLTSLTVGGCSTVVTLYDENNQDTQELSDSDMCKNIMKVLNPVNNSTSKLAIVNPILSSFLPEVLPKLLHAKKMNWLHFNTKSLRTISKIKVSKPDVVSIALAIASISNDFYGASWASDINEELTTRMVAREWLNIWFRSGFDQDYMNKLINNNSKKLTDRKEQIETLALKLGSTGALCDTYEFFNPFYECTGVENINYNYDKVVDIISEKLSKSNTLYKNITDLIGPVSDENGEIGTAVFVFDINSTNPETIWDEDQNGDLSNNINEATYIGTLQQGNNFIVGSLKETPKKDDIDVLSFEVPVGYKVISMQIINLDTNGFSNGFNLFLETSNHSTIDSLNTSTSNLSNGNDIFGKSPFEFLGPLPAGTYCLDFRAIGEQYGANSYKINIILEPSDDDILLHNNTIYGTVTSPYTGKVWLDRNLGAIRVCQSYDDTLCYGDYYQWGRNLDGHEKENSSTSSEQATNVNNVGHGNFITSSLNNSYDWAKDADSAGSIRNANWSKIDGSSICPIGFRVPTEAELKAETIDQGVDNTYNLFSNFLKLPSAGVRYDASGIMGGQGTFAIVYSSSVSMDGSIALDFGNTGVSTQNMGRASGCSIRCIRD